MYVYIYIRLTRLVTAESRDSTFRFVRSML